MRKGEYIQIIIKMTFTIRASNLFYSSYMKYKRFKSDDNDGSDVSVTDMKPRYKNRNEN